MVNSPESERYACGRLGAAAVGGRGPGRGAGTHDAAPPPLDAAEHSGTVPAAEGPMERLPGLELGRGGLS
jgi:hypothetical protein